MQLVILIYHISGASAVSPAYVFYTSISINSAYNEDAYTDV